MGTVIEGSRRINNREIYVIPMLFDPGISIKVFPDVYAPDDDSVLLIESLEVSPGDEVLEIGCGSGIVSIHCAKAGATVTAVDINPMAVECTIVNAEDNGVEIKARVSDVYENVHGTFDLVIFNLPYLPVQEEGMLEAAWSGGEDGLDPLRKLLDGTDEHLNPDGRLVVVTCSLMDHGRLDTMLETYKVKKLGSRSLFFERLDVLEISR